MPDPASVQGDEAAVKAAFADTLAMLRRRIATLIEKLAAQPGMSPESLKGILDGIAAQ